MMLEKGQVVRQALCRQPRVQGPRAGRRRRRHPWVTVGALVDGLVGQRDGLGHKRRIGAVVGLGLVLTHPELRLDEILALFLLFPS